MSVQQKKQAQWLEKIIEKIHKNKKLEYVLYVFIVLLVILIYFGGISSKTSEEPKVVPTQSCTLEEKLINTLSKIKGAGKVDVMISYSTTAEKIPALDVDTQTSEQGTNSQSQNPVTAKNNGSDELVVLMEVEPKIRGAIIVAEGASDVGVRLDLQRAAQTALDLPASKVEVFSMKLDK